MHEICATRVENTIISTRLLSSDDCWRCNRLAGDARLIDMLESVGLKGTICSRRVTMLGKRGRSLGLRCQHETISCANSGGHCSRSHGSDGRRSSSTTARLSEMSLPQKRGSSANSSNGYLRVANSQHTIAKL